VSKKIFGIDLGTTYSCIAYVDQYGVPSVVNNADGQPTTPSVVIFNPDGSATVGQAAKDQAAVFEDRFVELVKRHMGDPEWSFTVDGQSFTAPEVSSKMLAAVVEDARMATQEPVEDVVITVPAYFGQAEREATRAAGSIAGLNVVDIINEPTAAAFTYGFGRGEGREETVLVYDLGGGTFDVTVIALREGKLQVVATLGDHELGGTDWDDILTELLAGKFLEAHPDADDPMLDPTSRAELKGRAEDAKRQLSTMPASRVKVQSGAHLDMVEITREEFDQATASKLEQTIDITRKVLDDARDLGSPQIDRLLLVGGSSLMPQVPARLRDEFGLEPELSDPHMAVAKGAALWGQKAEITVTIADELRRQGVDVNGSLEDIDEAKLDEVVQQVAPTVGLTREAARKLVETEASNVCSQGFGMVAHNEANDREEVFYLIHRNTALPATYTDTFYTRVDDQPVLNVQVREQATQEEQSEVDSTVEVVGGQITGLPPGHPRGTPIEVTFAMDNSGRLKVTAKHPGRPDPLVLEQETGSVMTEQQIDESRERMAGIARQR
jgi:molecular chaperone DnaK